MVEWAINAGIGGIIYQIFFYSGFVGLFIFLLCTCKKYKIEKWKSVVFTVSVYLMAYVWMFLLYWVAHGFQNFGGNNIVRIFVWLPVFVWIMAKILKIDYKTALDFVSPCLCINHGIAHLGCIFAGCCHGYVSEFGVFNPIVQQKTFPIQPIEAVTALIIAVIIALRNKKRKYVPDGLSFPIMLMLFGYTRFIFEFFRDNRNTDLLFDFLSLKPGMYWCYITTLGMHALFAAVVGTVWVIIAKLKAKKRKKVTADAC